MHDVRGRYLAFQGSPRSHGPAFPAGGQLRLSIPGRRLPLAPPPGRASQREEVLGNSNCLLEATRRLMTLMAALHLLL